MATNRNELEEAINHLLYLIVHRFHPDKFQDYSLQLEKLRDELQRLDEKHTAASAGLP